MLTRLGRPAGLALVPRQGHKVVKGFPLRGLSWDFRRQPDDEQCLVDVETFRVKDYLKYLVHPRT